MLALIEPTLSLVILLVGGLLGIVAWHLFDRFPDARQGPRSRVGD